MTERERLIELIKQKQDGGAKYGDHITHETKCSNAELADYLLENGVIVLPVKIGDTVYRISEYWHPPYFSTDNGLVAKRYISTNTFKRSDIYPKDLYFTKEEAEKVLAERNGA